MICSKVRREISQLRGFPYQEDQPLPMSILMKIYILSLIIWETTNDHVRIKSTAILCRWLVVPSLSQLKPGFLKCVINLWIPSIWDSGRHNKHALNQWLFTSHHYSGGQDSHVIGATKIWPCLGLPYFCISFWSYRKPPISSSGVRLVFTYRWSERLEANCPGLGCPATPDALSIAHTATGPREVVLQRLPSPTGGPNPSHFPGE